MVINMRLVALDSSGLAASVAVVKDDILEAEYTIQYKKTHSQTLVPMLDEVRRMIELDFGNVDAIAVASGPGSFTGLRIGAAVAKGLSLAVDKPIIAVPTLDALAYNLYGADKIVCPIMDARRGQVYSGIYEFVREDGSYAVHNYALHSIKERCAAVFAQIAKALNELGREVIFLGDGVPVFKGEIEKIITVPYSFAPAHMNRQRAASVGALGGIYYRQGKTVSGEAFAPEYLRLPQAERENIVIRPMERADVERVSELEEQTFSMPWSCDDFLDMLKNDNARYYVAERGGKLVGSCGVLMAAGEGNITNVVVEEKERNQGIAFKMLKYLMDEGLKDGLSAYTLEVRKSNAAAIHLYEKLGFVSEGVRPGFYEKPAEDAVIMWKR